MSHQEEHSACGDPGHEKSLLGAEALGKWKGSPVGWIEASPHMVHADLTTERNGLVMIDGGTTHADFRYGAKSMSREFTPGSIGFFAVGTELKSSRWRWTHTRRIHLDLDADLPGGKAVLESFRALPRHTEIEFRDPELTAVLRAIVAEIAQGSPHGQLFAESLSLGVAMRLHGRSALLHSGGSERGKLASTHLRRVEDLVESRIGKEIPLSALAAAAGFSAPQFVRLFKNTLGCTPHQYVLKKRLEHARGLVVASALPLAVVASSAGFSSQSHMTSAFVRAFAAAPGQMRRRARTELPVAG